MWSIDSPKSIGEPIGIVKEMTKQYFTLTEVDKLNNGDGLCYLNKDKELKGLRVNKIDGSKVYFLENDLELRKDTFIYRNFDHEFDKLLSKKTADRKILLNITLQESINGFTLEGKDEDNNIVSLSFESNKEISIKDQTENIKKNLSKTGNTIFKVENVLIEYSENWFMPSSLLSDWRRQLTDQLLELRISSYKVEEVYLKKTSHAFPTKNITYLGNVMNQKGAQFYVQHQSNVQEMAFEKQSQKKVPLMFTRHCIKQSIGWCPKETSQKHPYQEPFFLLYNNTKLRLEFDCKNCEMKVFN